jgi:hypothetical protein
VDKKERVLILYKFRAVSKDFSFLWPIWHGAINLLFGSCHKDLVSPLIMLVSFGVGPLLLSWKCCRLRSQRSIVGISLAIFEEMGWAKPNQNLIMNKIDNVQISVPAIPMIYISKHSNILSEEKYIYKYIFIYNISCSLPTPYVLFRLWSYCMVNVKRGNFIN